MWLSLCDCFPFGFGHMPHGSVTCLTGSGVYVQRYFFGQPHTFPHPEVRTPLLTLLKVERSLRVSIVMFSAQVHARTVQLRAGLQNFLLIVNGSHARAPVCNSIPIGVLLSPTYHATGFFYKY